MLRRHGPRPLLASLHAITRAWFGAIPAAVQVATTSHQLARSVCLDMETACPAELGPQAGPVDPMVSGDLGERGLHALVQPAHAADVDVRRVLSEERGDLGSPP